MPEHTLSYLIADVARLHQKAFERSGEEARMPLTAAEARTLAHVLTQPGLRQSALAERMGIEPMTLSIYLDRLAKHALVERVAARDDRRAKVVVPSGTAEAVAAVARRITSKLRSSMTSGLSASSVDGLVAALEAVRQNLLAELGQAPERQVLVRTTHVQPATKRQLREAARPSGASTEDSSSFAQSAPLRALADSEADDGTPRGPARHDHPGSISWSADAYGAVTQATNWDAYTGQSLAHSGGYGWLNMVHDEDRSSLLAQWQRSVATSRTHDAVFRVQHVSGRHRWVRAQASLLDVGQPSLIQWVGVLTDIEQQAVAPAEPLVESA